MSVSFPNLTDLNLETGQVYSWGYNSKGQLGFAHPSQSVPTPTVIDGLSEIAHVAAGNLHSAALSG